MGDGPSQPRASTFQLLFVTWFLFGIAFIFFVTRITVRLKTSNRLFVDDVLALFAILLLCANGVIVTVMLPTMYIAISMEKMAKRGEPTIDVFGSLTFFLKMQFAQTLIYWTCLWSVKASFLAFFKRLVNSLKGHALAWWIIVAITVLGYTVSVISYPVSCASFEPLGCTSQKNASLALVSLRLSTGADILTDVLIIALPMSLAMRVRLPWRSRLALIGVFALGMFVVLFSVVRIIVTNTHNTLPELSWLALWSVIEASVACIVCNLAPFKVIFKERMRTYQSDPCNHENRQYVREPKGTDSLELSSSSRPAHLSPPSRPVLHSPMHPQRRTGDNFNGRGSFQQVQRNIRRGLQTFVFSDRTRGDKDSKVWYGAMVVTREVDRKEIPADQATLPGERSEEMMRTTRANRGSEDSDKIILLPEKPGWSHGRAC